MKIAVAVLSLCGTVVLELDAAALTDGVGAEAGDGAGG